MPRMVYGNDYGDVANRELAMDSQRDNRYFASLRHNLALEELARRQQQEDFSNAYALAQMVENARRYRGEQDYRNQQTRSSFLDRILQNQQFYDELGSRERIAGLNLRRTEGREADRDAERDYSEALQMVNQGVPPGDIGRMFKFNPAQSARLAAHFANLARMEEADLGPLETSARANQSIIQGTVDNARRSKAEQDALKRFTPFTLDSTIKKRVADMALKDLPMLEPQVFNNFIQQMILKEKLDALLRGNPATQQIEMIPQPRRFSQASPALSTPGSAPASPAVGYAPPTTLPAAGPVMPTSQAEFAALPKGALYINPADGKVYRKR